MKKGLIITAPEYDDVTEYFAQFSKDILKEAEKEGIPIKHLSGKDATKESFEKAANSFPYKLVVLNGHGNAKEIFGNDQKAIVSEGINDNLLAERITYARACEAGASLGKSIVSLNKDGCFIGYELPFQFYANTTWTGNPLKDTTAKIFFDPSNIVPISLINGKSASSAHEASKKRILKNFYRVLRNRNADTLAIAEALWNNYEGQVLLGNPEASL